jgi:hypothetical protein
MVMRALSGLEATFAGPTERVLKQPLRERSPPILIQSAIDAVTEITDGHPLDSYDLGTNTKFRPKSSPAENLYSRKVATVGGTPGVLERGACREEIA